MIHKEFRKCFLQKLGNGRTIRAATEGNSGLRIPTCSWKDCLVPQPLAYEWTDHSSPNPFPPLENEPYLHIPSSHSYRGEGEQRCMLRPSEKQEISQSVQPILITCLKVGMFMSAR